MSLLYTAWRPLILLMVIINGVESRKYFFLNWNRHYKENVVESVIKLVSLGEGYLPHWKPLDTGYLPHWKPLDTGYLPHWKPLDTYIRLVSGDAL